MKLALVKLLMTGKTKLLMEYEDSEDLYYMNGEEVGYALEDMEYVHIDPNLLHRTILFQKT